MYGPGLTDKDHTVGGELVGHEVLEHVSGEAVAGALGCYQGFTQPACVRCVVQTLCREGS